MLRSQSNLCKRYGLIRLYRVAKPPSQKGRGLASQKKNWPGDYLQDTTEKPAASEVAIVAAEARLGVVFPDQYRELLLLCNGCRLNFKEMKTWINSIEDAVAENEALGTVPQGYFFFGSNGGGEAFAFDLRNQNAVYLVAYISSWRKDAIKIGSTLSDLFDRLMAGESLYPH